MKQHYQSRDHDVSFPGSRLCWLMRLQKLSGHINTEGNTKDTVLCHIKKRKSCATGSLVECLPSKDKVWDYIHSTGNENKRKCPPQEWVCYFHKTVAKLGTMSTEDIRESKWGLTLLQFFSSPVPVNSFKYTSCLPEKWLPGECDWGLRADDPLYWSFLWHLFMPRFLPL